MMPLLYAKISVEATYSIKKEVEYENTPLY
jgi:hypothetical protein